MQAEQSAPWWPAVAHAGRLIRLPAAMLAMPEIAAAMAAWADEGTVLRGEPTCTPPASRGPSREAARVAAWKRLNRAKVLAQQRKYREKRKLAAVLAPC